MITISSRASWIILIGLAVCFVAGCSSSTKRNVSVGVSKKAGEKAKAGVGVSRSVGKNTNVGVSKSIGGGEE